MLSLLAVPALADNYIWVMHEGSWAWAVDPGDAAPVQAALQARGLRLAGILVTHHHPDHTAGLAALAALQPCSVWGPAQEPIAGVTHTAQEGQSLQVLGRTVEVLAVPGHTAGHIAYLLREPDAGAPPLLFCGDTLFSAGCGRVFDGTLAQLHASLSRLAALPDATRVCCTHEYTLANLRFARCVEPDNPAVLAHELACQALRQAGQPTLPSRIDTERALNPFLRCAEPGVIQAARERAPQPASSAEPLAVFSALRQWKNQFS